MFPPLKQGAPTRYFDQESRCLFTRHVWGKSADAQVRLPSVISPGAMAVGARDKKHYFQERNLANRIMATDAITFQIIQLLKDESLVQK